MHLETSKNRDSPIQKGVNNGWPEERQKHQVWTYGFKHRGPLADSRWHSRAFQCRGKIKPCHASSEYGDLLWINKVECDG
jgi:hypothetical protein